MRLKRVISKYLWVVLILAMVPCVLYYIAGNASAAPKRAGGEASGLVMDEIMVKNTAVYTEYGFRDYVEFYNPTDKTIDLSGIGISDYPTQPRCVFPEGTFIDPGARVVMPLNTEAVPFGLSNGETMCVFDTDGSLLLSCEIPIMRKNTVLVRNADGSYSVSDTPTPGFPNDEQGLADYLEFSRGDAGLRISEICSENLTLLDGYDWVEITNITDKTVSLAGTGISDSKGDLFKVKLGKGELGPGECMAVSLGKRLGLKAGETVYLTQSDGRWLDNMEVLDAAPNQSQSEKGLLDQASPGYPNTADGEAAFAATLERSLIISEVMCRNKTYLKGPFGATHDYIEFTNLSDQPVDLSHYSVCKNINREALSLGEGTLQPGEVIVFHAEKDGRNFLAGYGILEMGISTEGDVVILLCDGKPVDVLSIPHMETDKAYGRGCDGRTGILASPSPGTKNGEVVR